MTDTTPPRAGVFPATPPTTVDEVMEPQNAYRDIGWHMQWADEGTTTKLARLFEGPVLDPSPSPTVYTRTQSAVYACLLTDIVACPVICLVLAAHGASFHTSIGPVAAVCAAFGMFCVLVAAVANDADKAAYEHAWWESVAGGSGRHCSVATKRRRRW